MNEKITAVEGHAEKIPSEREVAGRFEKILAGREFSELQKVEDEDGLYVWDVQTTDDDGDRVDICYKRAGTSATGVIEISAIHQALYTSDGIPCGAGTQFEYIDGRWKETV